MLIHTPRDENNRIICFGIICNNNTAPNDSSPGSVTFSINDLNKVRGSKKTTMYKLSCMYSNAIINVLICLFTEHEQGAQTCRL